MKYILYQLNKRMSADGNSSYDPKPVLAHHMYHILFASTVALAAVYPAHLPPMWVGSVYSLFWIVAEFWQWRDGASFWDCVFDAYQHQAVWIWCVGAWGFLVAPVFCVVYLILLYLLVDEYGDAKR